MKRFLFLLGMIATACIVAAFLGTHARAQTIQAPTRTTPYDWACLDASGAVLSSHQRFDTAFTACYNNPAGDHIQGGAYKLPARGTTTPPPPPPPVCPPKPADESQPGACPAGTSGTWTQTRTYVSVAAPSCWVAGSWTPTDPPSGACVAVPPPTPSAPANLAAAIAPNTSTPANSNVTLSWGAVASTTIYEVWRCAGATCTNFAFLADVPTLSYVNSNLPGGLVYRYKVRAWQPVTGPYSDVVTATLPTLPPPQANGSATIDWTAPTKNNDGSDITNLAGFRIAYGTSADALVSTVQVSNPALSSYVVTGLSAGTWYFAVRAYATTGAESDNSNVASKVIP